MAGRHCIQHMQRVKMTVCVGVELTHSITAEHVITGWHGSARVF